MIELLLLVFLVASIIFASLTIHLIRFIVLSTRVDKLLEQKGLLGLSDELIRERDRKIQAEYWKKYHPYDKDRPGDAAR